MTNMRSSPILGNNEKYEMSLHYYGNIRIETFFGSEIPIEGLYYNTENLDFIAPELIDKQASFEVLNMM